MKNLSLLDCQRSHCSAPIMERSTVYRSRSASNLGMKTTVTLGEEEGKEAENEVWRTEFCETSWLGSHGLLSLLI